MSSIIKKMTRVDVKERISWTELYSEVKDL